MNDIRRTILGVVFVFSLILLWDQWQISKGEKATFFPRATSAAANGAAISSPAQGASAAGTSADTLPKAAATSTATGAPSSTVPQSAAQSPVNASSEKIEVLTDVLRVTLDTEGGSMVRAEMLKHPDNAAGVPGTGKPVVLLDVSKDRVYMAQSGLIGAPAGSGFPTHKTLMRVSGERELKGDAKEISLKFESAEVGGLVLSKTFVFKRGAYDVQVTQEVRNAGSTAVSPQLYVQLVRDGNKPPGESSFYSTFTGPAVYSSEKKFQKIEFSEIEKDKADFVKKSKDGFVTLVQHYFVSAWLLPDGQERENFARKVDNNLYAAGSLLQLDSLAAGASKSVSTRLYVGPQEEKNLEKIYPGLELVKDYGVLTILAKPLFWLLDKLNSFLGNWGWSIVGLVVLLKIAFYWLNAQAYRSMGKMKAINPRVMEMRERLKDNPQEMQRQMMAIYKEEKVNPLGGCFPILIQIPVFISLYWVLLSSVEMRNAPWALWIHDLSAPDPWFVLPALMTATSLLQTWLNPTPPDPIQAKMMWIMPLVFGIMFFFFPAGLVLYWLTNNVLSIAQQWMINKQLGVLGK
jgi:YidC/Oxa1 family membrane protein insertase